ncbi:cell division protein ZapA [Asaia sp. W19]|uniref:cell division protein ZapA n=1 Tax=unclassified Asaia TaxID=2685023 RepID=UPI000F8D2957|nr:cell division protein ZapA [Asaia sp. W19]RUT24615.1 cell division protein ZapA [Asaia sp. W19]
MAQISLRLNGYSYTIGCQDGEERYLQELAKQVERRIERVRSLGTQGGESWTLVMAALLMADELHDLAKEILPSTTSERVQRADRIITENEALEQKLNLLAERAEGIAGELESA